MTEQNRRTYDLSSLIRRDRAYLAARWNNFCALDNLRTAIFVQHRHKRFAYRKLGERRLDFPLWILPKSFRGGFHRFLIAWCKRSQGVLHTVSELTENNLGNIERILADEINADALGANEPHHLLNLLFYRWRDVGEE